MPRIKEHDSRDFPGQSRSETSASAEGPGGIDMEEIQVVDGPNPMKEADALLFNEDVLTIIVHNSGDKFQENPVQVGVNGRMSYIWRGQKVMCKRKYVERLLRAQSDSVEQDVTAITEQEFNKLHITPTQRYPLTVLHDPHPDGAAWREQISQQA